MNNQSTANPAEPTTHEQLTSQLLEPANDEPGVEQKTSPPTPTLVMIDTTGAGACTGDACMLTIEKA